MPNLCKRTYVAETQAKKGEAMMRHKCCYLGKILCRRGGQQQYDHWLKAADENEK